MDTLYTFWDNTAHYKTKSVDFLGLMNSATEVFLRVSYCTYTVKEPTICSNYYKKGPLLGFCWSLGLEGLGASVLLVEGRGGFRVGTACSFSRCATL